MKRRLAVEEGGQQRELTASDCLAFGAPANTTIANESANPYTYVVPIARS